MQNNLIIVSSTPVRATCESMAMDQRGLLPLKFQVYTSVAWEKTQLGLQDMNQAAIGVQQYARAMKGGSAAANMNKIC